MKWDQAQMNVCECRRNGNRGSILDVEKDLRCCAGCGESVRRGAHRVNCHQRWPKFRANDCEATTLPESERRRGQAQGWKAGAARRRVGLRPATPVRYGESWIACIPVPSGGTAHSSVPRLPPDAIGMPGIEFLPSYALADGRCAVSACKGTNGTPTSCSHVPR